ncbi:NADPH-dependent F420 reductase [Amycolatopsis vastitatis]|uniref:NADPH-dependent F420 reductase n=1 Tax=Amycolatopsis vastitatis TaxID=1905142 RepID=A0A229TC31_9PSEU|nr:NAD(P)-binding domain-containing protein [Amycolatopsis vastitatis]OXM68491.1 NADPH-dependent F420 reductase [Amycolatopsis vastitatis]
MLAPADDPLGTICVLGAGRMGSALCRRFTAAGREVLLAARNRCRAAEVAEGTTISALPAAEAFERAATIVLAVPYQVALRLAQRFPAFADGKIVIDVTNPLTDRHDDLLTAPGTCAAVEIARAIPYTPVVKAFNTLTPEIVATASTGDTSHDYSVLIAGDEPRSKAAVVTLAAQMGFAGVDVGPLVYARHIEGLVLLNRAVAASAGGTGIEIRHPWVPVPGKNRRKAAVS